ncbi:hypothetical protein HPDFL43_05695 [Hoeflea phototrophica DFL-43]|jgi:hypothetical protein|uniref:SWIM-type domain-containing protein n=1 Tax=Hoeflea phototrophica (strain DSM 17068 / NCIMB 14078 / DFL-43) TaxID=411684 RepID=A9D4N9_HOEPD|nr:SWIM zinc finger family protein [Hoeflea phototrophica]EDQ33922.1 hypothetical protein HPDFL43_05695 [Hoeflea phototrophica DFL-43]
MLRFEVKGSARSPYQVTAEGAGIDLRMYCTCPAGGLGGQFCKHAAALLVGEISSLQSPAQDVERLRVLAAGSPLIARALRHVPRAAKRAAIHGYPDLHAVVAGYGEKLRGLGWHLECGATGVDGDEVLGLFKKTKSGQPRKWPAVSLEYQEYVYTIVEQGDGSIEEVRGERRSRPWIVRGKKTGTFGSLDRGLPVFLDEAERLAPIPGAPNRPLAQ